MIHTPRPTCEAAFPGRPLYSAVLVILSLPAMLLAKPSHDLCLYYTQPANPQVWEEALPIGSGRLGAMVFGGTVNERIQFNEDTLWTGKPHNYVRKGAIDMLPEIRKAVFADQSGPLVARIRANFLSDPIRQKAYQPFGDLLIEFPGHANVVDYQRELDLESAIATVSYRVGNIAFKREAIASYPDNVIAVHVTASQPGSITCNLKLATLHQQATVKAAGDVITLEGVVLDPKNNNEPGLKFQGRLLVRNDGGTVRASGDTISVEKANSLTLLIVAATSFKNWQDISGDPNAKNDAYVAAVKDQSWDAIRKRQLADYQPLFQRVKLDLGRTDKADLPTNERLNAINTHVAAATKDATGDPGAAIKADPALATLYFQMGRYMLISSSRPGTQPANLQGVWNSLLDPPWESKYTTNINFEMNYWPAEVTNLPETAEPFWDIVDDLRVSGARTARELYGCGGWVLHHNTDHWRGTAPINNVDGLWPTGAAWLCHHMWDHYLFSGDRVFLEKRAYPAMKEASQFFLDFLVKDPQTGYLVTNPSHSPEQAPSDQLGLLHPSPTMDNQLIRSLFTYTIEASTILGADSDFAARLEETRKQLPPNIVGSKGQLQEWLKDWDVPNNRHRHCSPLWGMYPGWDITPADEKIWNAAKVLLGWRSDGDTGWSFSWRAGLWARAHDGDMAYRQIYLQLARRTFPNLFDKCGPFQVDGNFGSTGAFAEMLIQSHLRDAKTGEYEIELLPALPKLFPKGSVSGLRARGGYTVSFNWRDGKVEAISVQSKWSNRGKLRYNGTIHELDLLPGGQFDGALMPVD